MKVYVKYKDGSFGEGTVADYNNVTNVQTIHIREEDDRVLIEWEEFEPLYQKKQVVYDFKDVDIAVWSD